MSTVYMISIRANKFNNNSTSICFDSIRLMQCFIDEFTGINFGTISHMTITANIVSSIIGEACDGLYIEAWAMSYITITNISRASFYVKGSIANCSFKSITDFNMYVPIASNITCDYNSNLLYTYISDVNASFGQTKSKSLYKMFNYK